MANFARPGVYENGDFIPFDQRASRVISTTGETAEQHITNMSGTAHGITIGTLSGVSQTEFSTQNTTIQNLITAIHAAIDEIGDDFDELKYLQEVSFTAATGDLTFTRRDNTTLTVNIPISELIVGITFDAAENELVITQQDGAEMRLSIAALIPIYTGSTGAQIQISITTGLEIQAVLIAGSVTSEHLVSSIQIPGTPTIETRPAANANNTQVPDTTWVNARIETATGAIPTQLDAGFFATETAMQAANLRDGAIVFLAD